MTTISIIIIQFTCEKILKLNKPPDKITNIDKMIKK